VILNSQHVSPVCEADNILVFDSGRIVEQGTHRELLDQGGLYARMYAHERLTAESQMSLDGIDVVDNLSNSTQIARDVPVPLGDTVGGYRSSTIKSEDKGQRRGPTVAEKLVDPQVTDELDTEPYTGRRLWGLVNYVRPYRKLALTVAPLVIIAAVFELSGPLLVKRSIDQYIVPKALDGLGPIVGVYWTVTVLLFLVRYVVLLSTSTIGQRVVRDLRIEVFKHILKQSLSFFDRQPVGRLMARLTTDVSAIDDFIRQGSAETLADVVMLISIVAAMFLLDWRLSFVCLSMLPVLATVSILYQRRLTQLYRLIRVRTSALSSYMAEQYGGMLTVQLFNRQAENRRAFEALNVAYTEATRKKIYADSLFTPTVMFLSNLAVALLLLLGGLRMIGAEAMSIGLLVAFLQYIDRTFAPVTNLAEKYGTFQDAIISAERIFNVLNLRPTLQDLPKPESLSMSNHISDIPDRGRAHLLGHIEFSGVYFSYDNVHPVLKNVSFEIKPGQRVAIIGRTGAGKTSIINVLCRFYEVQGGTVRIDGNDIRTMRQVDIRRQIALVLQDPMLFSGSIADNIRYGNERMTIEEVRRAAEYIGADRFISGLPGRYQYQLSVRGSNLSAGQRQLICFARAIALNPAAILVLDEATSNVDPESEVIIYDALQKLVSGRTSLTIAHRLSTVRNAELMIVLDQGRIVEIGSPGELLTRQGYYHSLLRHFAHQNTRSYGDFRTAAN
jgi:ATP-binding cassette subfamily B protein